MKEEKRPKIGVGKIVIKNNKVLLGKRKGAHGEGSGCFPGGHLEWNEDIEDCARREVKEETGIEIEDIRIGPFTNDFFRQENEHYVTLYALAKYGTGAVKVLEPEKCEEWKWFEWDNLPEPLFIPIQNLLKRGYNGSVANNVFEGNKGFYLRAPQTRIVNFTGVFQLGPT